MKVRGRKALEEVMVRRLKEDIREIQGGFPQREVVRIRVDGLPDDAPELVLSRLLDEYRTSARSASRQPRAATQAAAGLLVVGLQQRLLSSIEAFARSLDVHRSDRRAPVGATPRRRPQRSVSEAQAEAAAAARPGADDEDSDRTDEELEARGSRGRSKRSRQAVEAARTRSAAADVQRDASGRCSTRWRRSPRTSRHQPDAKDRALIDWIRENMCPGLPAVRQSARRARRRSGTTAAS